MGFVTEAKYRLTAPEAKKPPFFKKLQKISALIIGTGLSVAFAPGALIYGLITVGFGLGIGITAELTTKDTAADTSVKAEIKAIEKREEKKEVTNKTDNK